MAKELAVDRVPRQVIESRLLAALDDEDKVAIVCTKEDLTMLISSLNVVAGAKQLEMARDLYELKQAAFPSATQPQAREE